MKKARAVCRLIGHQWRKKRYRLGVLSGWVAEDAPVIVASGGWCAPSETVYDLAGPTWYRRCRRCGKSKAIKEKTA